MQNFKNLQLWKKSRELVSEVYQLIEELPKEEMFGLTSQIKRCSVSIPSNIAEGCGRSSNRDLAKFLSYSQGSCYELETQLILAEDLGLITQTEDLQTILNKIQELQKMNRALQITLLKDIK